MTRDHMTAATRLAPLTPLGRALRYLRNESKRGYCLDTTVTRLPHTQRAPGVLDRWLAGRKA